MDKVTPKKKAASKKKVAKKAVVKKATTKKASVKKAAVKKATRAKKTPKTITYQQRYQKIAEAAYLLAEKQSFMADSELDNWLAAETQIDNWIKADKIKLSE
jgi:long-subunit acyl-CoA synthetase (AMP-forming)